MNKLMQWVNERMSVNQVMEDHLTKYYAPKNFNFFYFFGSLAMLVLVNQLVTGIWLTMSYEPSADGDGFTRATGISLSTSAPMVSQNAAKTLSLVS